MANTSGMELYEKIKKDLAKIAGFVIVIQVLFALSPIGRDDTDGDTRSGMALRIDQRTGCHYLEGGNGGLTPRLDKSGAQVCTGQ